MISYQPTGGLSYDPADPGYWDPAKLRGEIDRVFEVCNGCRMCFKYCDTFPGLFDLLDHTHDGDVTRLSEPEVASVMGSCFQCKLCEVQCPYTPRDGHEYQLDFPKLVHRWAAVSHKETGPSLRDRVLGDPDATAAMARASLGLANVANRVPAHRILMEKVLGIHRAKQLPDFAGSTFERWARRTGRVKGPSPETEAVLFQTCYVQHNEPQIGRDALEVLDHNGVRTACATGFRCCGMPAWEHGDLEGLRANAHHNLDALAPFVEAGAKVLAINPTCAMMLRREYPELVAPEYRDTARRVADQVRDPGEFLWDLRKAGRFMEDFKSTPGPIAYHAPCHLRAQAIGFKGRDLMRKIPGTSIKTVLDCCGHDGTYAMKVESFDSSARIGAKAFAQMADGEAQVWATECPLAALQFSQHAGVKPLHPLTVLARAYRADGFATPVPAPASPSASEEAR